MSPPMSDRLSLARSCHTRAQSIPSVEIRRLACAYQHNPVVDRLTPVLPEAADARQVLDDGFSLPLREQVLRQRQLGAEGAEARTTLDGAGGQQMGLRALDV